MTDSHDTRYNINFFKPTNGVVRDSNRTITVFIIIWFIAVFGFQFLLLATNKMVPEQTLVTFNETWPKVQAGNATTTELQDFSNSLLMVLGKNIALSPEDKTLLQEAFSISVGELTANQSVDLKEVANALSLNTKEFGQVMIELLPHSLVHPGASSYSEALPSIMEKYCTHPQGPLTNFKFLGFPFHYWYTAQFLLILFVLLCLAYSLRIEKLYRKYSYSEEHN